MAGAAGAAPQAAEEEECKEICRQMEGSDVMAVEAWQREMEVVLERVRAAEDAVFAVWVRTALRTGWRWRRIVHFAALFGSRAVLEEGCTRTAGGPSEAAQIVDPGGKTLLHLAVMNHRLSVEDIEWVLSLHAASASTADHHGALPLHRLASKHASLTPELVDVVLQAFPPALQRSDRFGSHTLHCACNNPNITAVALRSLVDLDVEATGTANQSEELPLHLLLRSHESLAPELVNIVLEAFPHAPLNVDRRGALPLHHACGNRHMTAAAFRQVLQAFPEAIAIPDKTGRLPYHYLSLDMPDRVRCELASILMEATDTFFPCVPLCSDTAASSSRTGQRYVLPPPDPRWASRPHPLSRQGRLKAGLRATVRGQENVWQFQTGSSRPGRAVVDDMLLADLVRAGHRSLVWERLAAESSAVDVSGVDEAVLCALELGHVDVVRDLLTGASSCGRVSCSAELACRWLGALMRHPQQDYGWLVEWVAEQRSVWGDVDLGRLCLGAAALSGELTLVESMAAAWLTRAESASMSDEARAELGGCAVYGGSVAVLHWLQSAGLACYPTHYSADMLGHGLAKDDRLDMLELLHRERGSSLGVEIVSEAVENGAFRVLRWLHVHTRQDIRGPAMEEAIHHGHVAVVQFLHRHHNITRLQPGEYILAEAVRHSAPGTLSVVEYILRYSLCRAARDSGDDQIVTKQLVVNACTASTVRVEVVRYLVSRASKDVLRAVEEELGHLAPLHSRQPQDVFWAARQQLGQG